MKEEMLQVSWTDTLDEHLVDRQDQIKQFGSVLNQISHDRPVRTNLFEWYGGPGIGKSTLVKLLGRECQRHDAAAVLVNFREAPISQYLTDPTILVEDLVRDLAVQQDIRTAVIPLLEKIALYRLEEAPSEAVRSYSRFTPEDRLYRRPAWLDRLRDVTRELTTLIAYLGRNDSPQVRPIVLFFDETEFADLELADWIEEWIITPIAQMKHCVIVWTARRPWRWKRPEIRRRLSSELLKPFDAKEVRDQVRENSTNPDLAALLFQKVFVVTGGHPFANAVVISRINDLQDEGFAVTLDTFSQVKPELLREIYWKFIQGYVFRSLSPDEKTACELLSVVRLFDTTMLREVMRGCADREYSEWNQEEFGNLLLKLKKTQLLVWDKGYTIDPSIRHLIREYLQALDVPTFARVNETAVRVYEDWLGRRVENRNLFVIEELFHYACLKRVGQDVSLQDVLQQRLEEYPKWIDDIQALSSALDRLAEEIARDEELIQLTDHDVVIALAEQVRRDATALVE